MATSAVMNPSSPSKSDAARSPSLWDPSLLPELPELPPFDSAIMEDLMRITEEDNVGVGQPMAGGETFAGTVTSQVSETPAELRAR
ncbi:hypothetical protein HPP92_006572 [Vanilla planifolia]|uniref:Uncharacterized protein n=1 Tax=Vanilla planifolia TaxID=51239 RepID=A0A835REM7_VANPL|nr:hypothetical protein HPP92_006572 [Vanilla planifolia]